MNQCASRWTFVLPLAPLRRARQIARNATATSQHRPLVSPRRADGASNAPSLLSFATARCDHDRAENCPEAVVPQTHRPARAFVGVAGRPAAAVEARRDPFVSPPRARGSASPPRLCEELVAAAPPVCAGPGGGAHGERVHRWGQRRHRLRPPVHALHRPKSPLLRERFREPARLAVPARRTLDRR